MKLNEVNADLVELANHLYQNFVVNHWAHAEQLTSGKYNTVYKPLNQQKIYSVLSSGESCSTYQLSSGRIRWVCFDIDIKREVIAGQNYDKLKLDAESEVVKITSILCKFLDEKAVPYFLEHSGNRGAHLWILWEEYVDQSFGYALQQKILDTVKPLRSSIYTEIDRFPQTPKSQGRLGKGVKLPLSKHKKSGFHACLVKGPETLALRFKAPLVSLNKHAIGEQLEIFRSSSTLVWSEVARRIELDESAAAQLAATPAYIRKKITPSLKNIPQLNSFLEDLSKCSMLRPIIERYRTNTVLSEKERSIMVGLLRRIQTPNNTELGKELLLQLLSSQPNFNSGISTAKLSNLNLYPPTCSYLLQTLSAGGEACNAHNSCEVQKSPIELLTGCDIQSDDLFSLSSEQVAALKNAGLKYAKINDEIDLQFIRSEMDHLDDEEMLYSFPKFLSEKRVLGPYHVFERPESPERVRKLISLGAEDALISAWFTKILSGLFDTEVSPNTYGYRFEPSIAHGNLFKPWFPQWIQYVKGLSRIIEDNAFDDYWIVKIDIRSFYDSVPLARLTVKLGKGPSSACGTILEALDNESRRKYEVICATLIEWSRKISGNDRGLPQGPAFARYLAELYLLQFDNDVETLASTHHAQYFRWVDDIFLIAPSKIAADAINAKIRKEIEALSLEVSEKKVFLGTVRDYRNRFRDYSNDPKYFVDKATRNSRASSSFQRAQANEVLNGMIESDDGTGIQTENASFFLTHIKGSSIDSSKLTKELLKIHYGRGSLFKHLFDRLISDCHDQEYQTLNLSLTDISGFRLAVLLNSILTRITDQPLSDQAVVNLSSNLKRLHDDANSPLVKSLLMHIMLIDPKLNTCIDGSKQGTLPTLLECIKKSRNIDLTDPVIDLIINELSSSPIKDCIDILSTVMLDNNLTSESYKKASDKFFALVLEELEQTGPSSITLTCLQQDKEPSRALLRNYHMLCCLCSMTGSRRNAEEMKRVWQSLIAQTNSIADWKSNKPNWLKKADRVEINHTSCSMILAAVTGGDGFIPGSVDKHGLFNEYHYHLVVFIFAFADKTEISLRPTREALFHEATKNGMLYLEWLLSPENDVILYPSKKVCLRNIVENDITILQCKSQILVRHPASRAFKSNPANPVIDKFEVERSQLPFINTIYSLNTGQISLNMLIDDQPNLLAVIKLSTNIFRNLAQFRAEHLDEKYGVPNIFTDGLGLLKESLRPAVPLTALGPKLLVSIGENTLGENIKVNINDLETAWLLLLEKIERSSRSLLPYEHLAQIKAKNIKKSIPSGIDWNSQVKFLELFVECLEVHSQPTPFEIDHGKLDCAARFAQFSLNKAPETTEKRTPTQFGKTFDIYLSITGDTGEFATRMSFNPIKEPSDKSLESLYDALSSSLAWTKNFPASASPIQNLLGDLEEEFVLLAREVEPTKPQAINSDFKIVLRDAKKAEVGYGEDYELVVNGTKLISSTGEIIAPTPVRVCRFGSLSRMTTPLRAQHSADLRRGLVYLWSNDSQTCLFVADDIIRTMFEMIRKRSDALAASPSIDSAVLECLSDRSAPTSTLKTHASFHRAVQVISGNRATIDRSTTIDPERHLMRWLEQFNPEESSALLDVIAAHQCIGLSDVESLIKRASTLKKRSIMFSAKRLDDIGGVQRMFSLTQNGNELIRTLELNDSITKIIEHHALTPKTLVILVESIISGSQLTTSFEKHYLSTIDCKPEHIQENRLFDIGNDKPKFIDGMKRFEEIIILTAVYTERGAKRIKNSLSSILAIDPEKISIEGRPISDADCFLEDSPHIPVSSKAALERLVNDTNRIKSIFDPADVEIYNEGLRTFRRSNLVVRPNSVPKKHLKIFTLTPRNKFIQPLFRIINEHV